MTTIYNGSSYRSTQNTVSGSSGLSSSITGPRVINLATSPKGPMLEEVDAELKRLRNQFDTLRSDSAIGNENSSSKMNAAALSKPQSANDYYSGKISQSFEIKRDVGQRTTTTPATYGQPQQTTYSGSSLSTPTYSGSSLYTPISVRANQKPAEPSNNLSYSSRVGDSSRPDLSKSVDLKRAEPTRTEPTRFEIKRLDSSTSTQQPQRYEAQPTRI